MRRYRLASLATAFLVSGSCAVAQPPSPTEKDFLFDVSEGVPPELTKYALEGRFDAKRPFSLEIALQGDHWTIKFRYAGTEAQAFTLQSKKYPSLHFERAFVATRSPSLADPFILVVIPFGEPQTECFLNGEDVFRQVVLFYDAGRLVSVEERVFEDCNSEWRKLPLDPPSKG